MLGGASGCEAAVKLVVFDIDGTLTLGDGLGTRCFFSAFEVAFGTRAITPRLDAYRESTDAGIAREAFETALGRAPSDEEIDRHKQAYLRILEQEIARTARAYRPVPGADRAVSRLLDDGQWRVALATGNWRRAAALKLASASIPLCEPQPTGGFAEDGDSRTTVLRAALARARAQVPAAFERVVYVGDQLWDLAAARAAGVAFVGIASAGQRARLEAAGAAAIDDFASFDLFLASLEGGEGAGAAASNSWLNGIGSRS